MSYFLIKCKQIVKRLYDPDDRLYFNLGLGGVYSVTISAESEDDALDMFHNSVPIGALEDYQITIEPYKEE